MKRLGVTIRVQRLEAASRSWNLGPLRSLRVGPTFDRAADRLPEVVLPLHFRSLAPGSL